MTGNLENKKNKRKNVSIRNVDFQITLMISQLQTIRYLTSMSLSVLKKPRSAAMFCA